MILQEIAEKTKERIEFEKKKVSLEEIKSKALSMPVSNDFRFKAALRQRRLNNNGMAFICEVKKASPSRGIIAEDFPYVEIAKSYEDAGADAISCLTEPFYFKGSNEYLKEIAKNMQLFEKSQTTWENDFQKVKKNIQNY